MGLAVAWAWLGTTLPNPSPTINFGNFLSIHNKLYPLAYADPMLRYPELY